MDAVTSTWVLLLAIASFYLTAALQRPGLAQLVSAQLVLGAVPLAIALHRRIPATMLGLRAPHPRAWLGALLIGATAWIPNLHVALWVQTARGLPTRNEGVERLLEAPHLAVTIACLALVPALCEELAFRGLWARALAARLGVVAASVLSAVVFGGYHLSMAQGLSATLLGLVLAWTSLRGRSLWLSVAIHAVNNATALLAARGQLGGLATLLTEHPSGSLVGAVLITCAGLALVGSAPSTVRHQIDP